MKPYKHTSDRGLSMLEVLLTISAVGILSAMAVSVSGNFKQNVERAKLEQDVKSINSAINIYLSNGGNFDGISKPQEILDRMKSEHTKAEQARFVGMTGSTIDKRTAVRSVGNKKAKFAAVWDASNQKFSIQEDAETGVEEFYLNEALAEVEYAPINREQSMLAYNDKPGWIWAYEEKAPTTAPGPTVIPLGSAPDTAPRPPPQKLNPPSFSLPNGSYPEEDFPLSLSLTNPNGPSSWIMVSVDGSPFSTYAGPLTLASSSHVAAYVDGDPYSWIKSSNRYASYSLIPTPPPTPPAPLLAPTINLSSDVFNDSTPEITVTIANPNPAGSSSLFYSLVGSGDSHPAPSSWNPYTGSLVTNSTTYPNGFEVITYAKSNDLESYLDSATTTATTTAEFFDIPVVGNVLFVVDASGSMNRSFGSISRFEATILELVEAIERLPASIKFNVAMFDAGIHWTDGTFKLHNANNPNKQSLINQIEQVDNDSGTNYSAGLSLPTMFDPIPDQVIFLSDGQPSNNSYLTDLATLVSLGVRVDTIGLDDDQDSLDVLQHIANVSGGVLHVVEEP